MSIEQAFNKSIEYYDDWMRKALPNFNDIFSTAQDLLFFDTDSAINVLDLGAGTGLFSRHVLEKYPNADFVLYDLADKMLETAKTRFKDKPDQFKYVVGDYREIRETDKVDLVISSLSIHHLSHKDKKKLFQSIFHILEDHGQFINIDQIRGETPYLADLYWNHWLDEVRKVESSVQRIQESIDRRKTYDIDATMSEQLRWLKQAGFMNVDCVYKNFFIGVFLAMK